MKGAGFLICAFRIPLAFPFILDPLLPFPPVVKKCWGMAIVSDVIMHGNGWTARPFSRRSAVFSTSPWRCCLPVSPVGEPSEAMIMK